MAKKSTQKLCQVDIEAIYRAREVVAPIVRETPLLGSGRCSNLLGHPVYLKLENFQRTGSFKIRGAYYKLTKLAQEGIQEVAAISAGNHAQGVAFAGQLTGITSTIFVPEGAALSKIQATTGYGARVVCAGKSFDEARDIALAWLEENPVPFISPFDDDDIIAGQGTLGLEILAQVPDVDTILVPVGGGGLISGIAIAVKTLRPQTRIIGIQSQEVPSLYQSFKKKKLQHTPSGHTIADGIAIKQPCERTFQIMREKVDEMLTVTEDEIIRALFFCIQHKHIIAEGAGVVGLAALLSGKVKAQGPTVVLISGGNIDVKMLDSIISTGMIQQGRFLTFKTLIKDYPGSLKKILELLARHQANVLSIQHARLRTHIPLGHTEVEIELETRDQEHAQEILDALRQKGYTPEQIN